MKKLFTLALAGLMSLNAMAEDYDCGLAVAVYGAPSPYQTCTISCTKNAKGKYDIQLKDFYFGTLPVGNINITDIDAEEEDGSIALTTSQDIYLEGALAAFGALPCTLEGYITDGDIVVSLNIPLVGVQVALTSRKTALYGGDFENWHKASNADEPNGWHTIKSGTGTFASFGQPCAAISDDVPEGSVGTKSVRISSSSILGISANGTITTGRMNVGSYIATDPLNNVYINWDSKDVDGNGDPFYNTMVGRPSSLTFWYKFKNGKNNTKPALVRAIALGYGNYQDPVPADTKYDNIISVAETNLEATDTWKKVTIPFDYASYAENYTDPATCLITFNTCNVAGGGTTDGTDVDVLCVDDVTLDYNAVPTTMYIFDTPVSGFSADKTEYDITLPKAPTEDDIYFEYENDANAAAIPYYDDKLNVLTVNIYGEDLKTCKTYTFNVNIDPTGINGINADNRSVAGRYNINGQKVGKNTRGLVITRFADGKVVKRIN